jgi:flagellar biogenesis protein FliO
VRYRDGQLPEQIGAQVPLTDDFVSLTVCLTLIIGVIFVVGGLYGRQRWLQIWGGLTLVACGVYYAWLATR